MQILRLNTLKIKFFLVLVLALANVNFVGAHESHETRIQSLDQQLNQPLSGASSETTALLLERADLHRRAMNWNAALHDYEHVAAQEPSNLAMLLGRGQLHLDRHQYDEAVEWSRRVLHLYPNHANGAIQQARALAGISKFEEAAIVFNLALQQLDSVNPEHYVEQAKFMLAIKNRSDSIQRAIDVLDKGAYSLGHLVSLHERAYELEIESKNYEAALHRIDTMLNHNGSLLNWRLKRCELLLTLGRSSEAQIELSRMLDRIRQLPVHHRNSHAFQSMMQRGQDLMQRVNESARLGEKN